MSSDPDEEALHWAGDEDLGRDSGAALPAPATGVPAASGPTAQTPSALLIVYGILIGVYALFVVGWIIAVFRDPTPVFGVLPVIMYQFGEFLALASPLLWGGIVLVLTRDRAPLWRLLWLLVGVVLLVPLPFILGGWS